MKRFLSVVATLVLISMLIVVSFALPEEIDVTYGSTPTVDGSISVGEYTDAHSVTFATSGGTCTVYFKHNGSSLYVAFDVPNVDAGSAVQIFVDTNYDRASVPQTDDYRLTIGLDGALGENQGTGTGWTAWGPAVGWTGARQQFAGTWNAEFAIPYAKLGITAGVAKTIGISFWNAWAQSDYRWPTAADWATPSTWGAASSSDNWAPPILNWPMFRHDLRHTGYSLSSAPTTNNTLWNYTTGGAVQSSPAVADGKVFVGSGDSKVYALNASNGAFIWSYTTGALIYSSPAVADGMVFIGSDDLKVYALNMATGAHLWNYTTGGVVYSSPAVADGKVYVGSNDKKVYALNASNGAFIWSYTTGSPVYSSPAVADGMVFVGSGDSKVYALNASNGAFIWSYTTVGGVWWSSPAVADGMVFVGSEYTKVCALNVSTGAHLWNYTTGGAVDSSPAVADGKVYVGSNDNKVYALNASTGAHLWNYTTGGVVWSSPAVAGGKVYVGSMDHKVYAFGPPPPYDVTIKAWCYNERAYVSASITMDGSPTGYATPHTFAGLNGTHLFTVPSTDLQGHPFTGWSTGETKTTITVSSAGNYTAYYGGSRVGGISILVDKLALLAPYIGLASSILVATAATAIYVKRRKKKQ